MNAGYKDKMLFIIRQAGLKKYPDVTEYVLDLLKQYNYTVIEYGLVNIDDSTKMVTKFYKDKLSTSNKEVQDTIYKSNGNKLFYIITDYKDKNKCSTCIKNMLRSKFPNTKNKWMNYFHSSDTPRQAHKEIRILKSNSSKNFNNLGGTYKKMHKRGIKLF